MASYFSDFLRSSVGTSIENVSAGLSAAAIVTFTLVIAGNTLVMDIEERTHIVNGNALVEAVSLTLSADNSYPAIGISMIVTAEDLKLDDRFNQILDPMGNGKEYDLTNSQVMVVGAYTLEGSKQIYKANYYVKLISANDAPAPSYCYIDQIQAAAPVEQTNLKRIHVFHPKRDSSTNCGI